MKIQSRLFQFNEDKALLVVASRHLVEFYVAKNGEIEKVDEFQNPKPTYSDREGFFETSTGGGFVYENLKNYSENKMVKGLERKILDFLKEGIDEIFLFSPKNMSAMIEEYLPSQASQITQMHIYGNFVGVHPFELLRKIEDVYSDSVVEKVPSKLEALKILQKSARARRVVGE
jgi:hypothetical protein